MKRITLFFLTVIFFLFGIFGISQAEEPHRSSQIRCYNDKFSPIPCQSTGEFFCQGSICVVTKNLSDLGSSGGHTSSTPAGRKTEIHSPKRKAHAGKGSPHPEDSQNRDIKLQTSPLAPPVSAPAPAKPTVLSEPTSPTARPAQPMPSTTTTSPTVLPIQSNDTGNAPLREPVSPTFSPSDPRDTEKPQKISESLRKALEQYNTTRAASSEDDPVLENIFTTASTPSQTPSEADDSSFWEDDRENYISSFMHNLRLYYQETAVKRGLGTGFQVKENFLDACLGFINQYIVTELNDEALSSDEREAFRQEGYAHLETEFLPAEPLLPSVAEEQATDDQSVNAEWRVLEQAILEGLREQSSPSLSQPPPLIPPPPTTSSETSPLMTPPQQSGSQLSSTLKAYTPFPGLKPVQRDEAGESINDRKLPNGRDSLLKSIRDGVNLIKTPNRIADANAQTYKNSFDFLKNHLMLNDGPDPDDVSTPPQGDDDGNSSGWENEPLVFDDPSSDQTEDASVIISGPETGGNFNGSGNFQETALPTVHETPALPVEDQEPLPTGDLPPTGPQTDETKSPLTPNSDAEGPPVNAGETREEPLIVPDTPTGNENFPGIPTPLTAGEALGDNFSTDEDTLSLPESPEATDLIDLPGANFGPPEPIAADSVIGADPSGHAVGVTGENTGAAPVTGMDSFTTEATPTIETTAPESFNDVMARDSAVTESSAPTTSDVSVPTDVAISIATAQPAVA